MSCVEEVQFTNELVNSLTQEEVHRLQEMLKMPAAIVERVETNPTKFIYALKEEMDQFDPTEFINALDSINRPELIATAKKIKWMKASNVQRTKVTPSIETFVSLLRREITTDQWKLILGSGKELKFEKSLKSSIEEGKIKPDLVQLCETIKALQRYDVVEKIQKHIYVFHKMNDQEFETLLLDELESSNQGQQENLVVKLREYTKQQNEMVYLRFDDDETIPLDSVYTPLTVVKEIVMQSSDDTSLNEIEFLRTMREGQRRIEVVDFISIISTLDANEPIVLCLIGNPGSGKSFLCKYLALQYANGENNNFTYQLSLQCRNEGWHAMEKNSEDKEEKITTSFVRDFLAKTTPLSTKWSKSLHKYLVKTDGESLLLILDGVDEFTKDVPFKTTLLYSLLNRQILTRATILLTSRPGEWSNKREQYGDELRVEANYQVLGFSPSDRDLYFKKRISTQDKLRDVNQLFLLHDEINQLSLVPVNASLFSSLFNETTDILSHTLTHLYTELILYTIRRQLARMGLRKLTRVHKLSQFHPTIWKCITDIAFEAYEGIYHRELSAREKDKTIRIDQTDYTTERLGLMQVQVRLLKIGQRVNVWVFAHLTLQEFMSAVYLSDLKWLKQCVIMRFLVSSEEVFAMYRLVARFLCGILVDRASCHIPIICCNLIPDTMPFIEIPMCHQLCYFTDLVDISDWIEFIKYYLLITTIIIETNSPLITKIFPLSQKSITSECKLLFSGFCLSK